MVTTRSSQGSASRPKPSRESPRLKRKPGASDDHSSSPAKRTKVEASARTSKQATPRPKAPLRSPTQDEIIVAIPSQSQEARQDADDAFDDSVYETPATHNGDSVFVTPATHLADKSDAFAHSTPRSHLATSKGSKVIANGHDYPTTPSAKPTSAAATTEATVMTHGNKRIRFASEEIAEPAPTDFPAIEDILEATEAPIAPALEVEESDDDEDDDDDDDDAPETVTRSDALQSARSAQSHATKAIEAQKDVARAKRRERDEMLRKQASSVSAHSKKSRSRARADEKDVVEDLAGTDLDDGNVGLDNAREDDLSDGLSLALPKYLPQELLDAAPAVRPLSPPPQPLVLCENDAAALKLSKLNTKPPKDISRGPVNVRVMQDLSALKLMAPKAEPVRGSQREIRSTWLMGRKGRAGAMKDVVGTGRVERKAWGGSKGFVR